MKKCSSGERNISGNHVGKSRQLPTQMVESQKQVCRWVRENTIRPKKMLRESALNFLRKRDAKVGETVQNGWFVFRIVEGRDGIDLESLDFKEVASFTSDFEIAEQIHWAQQETLARLGVEELPCTLRDPALVSRSYTPGGSNAFIERCPSASESDCGWYVGVVGETLDFKDSNSFVHRSLYELTIADQRFARFWLLPVGYRVYFDSDEPRTERVEKAIHVTLGP